MLPVTYLQSKAVSFVTSITSYIVIGLGSRLMPSGALERYHPMLQRALRFHCRAHSRSMLQYSLPSISPKAGGIVMLILTTWVALQAA